MLEWATLRSLLFFNICMDGEVMEVNTIMIARNLILVNADNKEWSLNKLLFTDDNVCVTEKKLFQLIEEFGRV